MTTLNYSKPSQLVRLKSEKLTATTGHVKVMGPCSKTKFPQIPQRQSLRERKASGIEGVVEHSRSLKPSILLIKISEVQNE